MARSRQAVRSQNRWPWWAWFGIGAGAGAALCAVVFLGGHAPNLRNPNVPVPNPDAAAPAPADPGVADKPARAGKEFDFYRVLPEMEVHIPDAEVSAKARAEATKPNAATTEAPQPAARYVLQTGSFPSAADADTAKARLALLGFVANVQAVTINGTTWHRVRLGPFRTASELEAAKQKLAEGGISAIALKEQ